MSKAKLGGVDINAGAVSGATLDGTCDVSAAVGAGGTPADGSITNAKLADMAEGTIKGRAAGAGTGAPTDRTLAQVKTDLALVKADVGLGNVDNTSDANKPVSTAQQAALDAKEGLVSIARATGAAVAVNSTSVVNMASVTNTVAAGDTFEFYLDGYVLNNSGATRTYTIRVTIGATTFDLAVNPTYAASASNIGRIRCWATVSVISTSSIVASIECRAGVSAAVGTVQNNVLAQDRSVVRTSTNNETGSKTVAIGIFSSNATATQTFTRTRCEILKGAAI